MDNKKTATDISNIERATEKVPWLCSSRVGLACVGFFGFVNLYALRVNMSVAMVCMVNHSANSLDVNTSTPDDDDDSADCFYGGENSTTQEDGPFAWPKYIQGIILGSFFWGYLLTQILGGWLAGRLGGKNVFGWPMLACAIATLLTPVGAYTSPYLLIVLRIIAGLGQGVVFPACHFLWANWAPPLERTKLIGFTYAGAQIGNVITFPLSGLLCDALGWESIFYILGSFGVVWFIAWMVIVSDSPAQHKRISQIERFYIEDTIGTDHVKLEAARKKLGIPWTTILSSPAVWAIVVAHACANWGTYTLLTNIPTFMNEVLKFDIKSNGFFSAIPYIAYWMCINVSGNLADTLRTRGWKTVVVRKIMYGVGSIGPGAFLIGTGFVSCSNPYAAVTVLTMAMGCCGFQYSGYLVNHVDIAPPFAGILFGISNTFATIPGFMAPYVIAVITKDGEQSQWQTVFYISAAIYTTGFIVYTIFAKGEILEWAKPYMFLPEGAGDGGIAEKKDAVLSAEQPPVYQDKYDNIINVNKGFVIDDEISTNM